MEASRSLAAILKSSPSHCLLCLECETYSQKFSPYSSQRVPLQQQHLQVGQQTQRRRQTVEDKPASRITSSTRPQEEESDAADLPADVVVGEVQPGQREQRRDFLWKLPDLVVSQLQLGYGRQTGQLLRLQLLNLVIPSKQLLQTHWGLMPAQSGWTLTGRHGYLQCWGGDPGQPPQLVVTEIKLLQGTHPGKAGGNVGQLIVAAIQQSDVCVRIWRD